MQYRFSLLIFLIVASIQFCPGQLSRKETKLVTEFSRDITEDLKKDKLHAGLSVAIIKNKQVIWAATYGYSGREKETPADSATIYRIGSITKTFTATILMQLVEEGKVKLNDPVENYVPEVKSIRGYNERKRITLLQLASHTSGLNREPDMPLRDIGATAQWENTLLSCIPYTSFDHNPEQGFLYSNIGFALLGLALERASGVSYIQMVKERIFTPLHMDNSYFLLPGDKLGMLAEGIENKTDGTVNLNRPLSEIAGRGYRVPNGGIFSTPLDLAKFVIALMDGSPLLKQESLRVMQQIPQGGSHYGLGLELSNKGGMDLVGHNGSVPGYTGEFKIELRTGNAIILLRNYNNGNTNLEETARFVLERL
jgi:CubicO group peptidase (beta-lactamase class C family)